MTDTPLSANIQLKAQLFNIFCHVSFKKATESPISSEMKKQEVDFPPPNEGNSGVWDG